jgi:TolA-binding protein
MKFIHSDNPRIQVIGMRYTFMLIAVVALSFSSCATPKPALYDQAGVPFYITEYEKIALKEYEEQRYDNAIEAYEAIIEHYPENSKALAWANYEIGYCFWMLKDYESAELRFRKVLNEFQEPAAKTLAGEMLEKIEKERAK